MSCSGSHIEFPINNNHIEKDHPRNILDLDLRYFEIFFLPKKHFAFQENLMFN
jgi:hypothetical protein